MVARLDQGETVDQMKAKHFGQAKGKARRFWVGAKAQAKKKAKPEQPTPGAGKPELPTPGAEKPELPTPGEKPELPQAKSKAQPKTLRQMGGEFSMGGPAGTRYWSPHTPQPPGLGGPGQCPLARA